MWPTYRQYACNHIKGEHFSSYFFKASSKKKIAIMSILKVPEVF